MVRVFKEAGKLKKNPNCKGDCLDGGTLITAADIQAGLKMYNVTLREGDAVFIHTGYEDLFLQYPAMNAVYNASEPGIGMEAAKWLADQKVVAIGSDTFAVGGLAVRRPLGRDPGPRLPAPQQRHPHH